jgi:hypothetical protein
VKVARNKGNVVQDLWFSRNVLQGPFRTQPRRQGTRQERRHAVKEKGYKVKKKTQHGRIVHNDGITTGKTEDSKDRAGGYQRIDCACHTNVTIAM